MRIVSPLSLERPSCKGHEAHPREIPVIEGVKERRFKEKAGSSKDGGGKRKRVFFRQLHAMNL